jgi:hypothetical protein
MTTRIQDLSEQIEKLVREHIEASRRAAASAVERAFASTATKPRAQPAHAAPRATGRRRPGTELAALSERLYESVCAQPGETMAVLAPEVGKTSRELHRPMAVLKHAGRVRSVGQRHQTRYYPGVRSA